MVVTTRFDTDEGSATLTDFMPLHPDDRHNDIGKHSRPVLCRIVDGLEGAVELDVELAIRPEFGLTTPLLLPDSGRDRGIRAGVRWRSSSRATRRSRSTVPCCACRLAVGAGERFVFGLQAADPWSELPPPPSAAEHRRARVR